MDNYVNQLYWKKLLIIAIQITVGEKQRKNYKNQSNGLTAYLNISLAIAFVIWVWAYFPSHLIYFLKLHIIVMLILQLQFKSQIAIANIFLSFLLSTKSAFSQSVTRVLQKALLLIIMYFKVSLSYYRLYWISF